MVFGVYCGEDINKKNRHVSQRIYSKIKIFTKHLFTVK